MTGYGRRSVGPIGACSLGVTSAEEMWRGSCAPEPPTQGWVICRSADTRSERDTPPRRRGVVYRQRDSCVRRGTGLWPGWHRTSGRRRRCETRRAPTWGSDDGHGEREGCPPAPPPRSPGWRSVPPSTLSEVEQLRSYETANPTIGWLRAFPVIVPSEGTPSAKTCPVASPIQ